MKSILHPDLDLQDPAYTPNRLLDRVAEHCNARNDAALSYLLECNHGALTHIRQRHTAIGPWLMVKIMDVTGWHVQTVRELMGMPYDGPTVVAEVAGKIRHVPLGVRYRTNERHRKILVWNWTCTTLARCSTAQAYPQQNKTAQHSAAHHHAT